jgi:hypothetical protein
VSVAGPRRVVVGSVLLVCTALTAWSVVLALTTVSRTENDARPVVLYAVGYTLLGGILLWRRADLVIPWLMVALGVVFALIEISSTTALLSEVAAYRIGVVLFASFAVVSCLLFQTFPTGHPLPGVWRWLTRFMLIGAAGLIAGVLVGVKAPSGFSPLVVVIAFVDISFGVGMVSSIPAIAVRFHRSRGVERAQLKWFLFSVALAVACWFVPITAFFVVAPLFPLVAIALALLRYRLYDIDRIVSRTTAYALSTALLVATYLAVVTLTSRLLHGSSQFAVALATLAAAAAFRPVLRATQHLVDRRFNRPRFDGVRVVEQFGDQLRDEVDSDVVTESLLIAIHRCLQPAGANVWMRPS